MKKILTFALTLLCLSLGAYNVKQYNVQWTTPSGDASGSMPIGNGEVGANLWVEQNGDIVFYISRTDSWSETGELLKLGRVRVSISPSITSEGDFVQTLDLGKGRIRICGGGTSLDFFIDSDADVIYLTGKSGKSVDVKVSAEVWRDKKFDITPEIAGRYRSISGFAEGQASFHGFPDYIVSGEKDITVYHHNCESSYEQTLQLQKLEPENRASHDPFLNRVFGYSVTMKGAEKASDLSLEASTKDIDIRIATLTGIFPDRKGWETDIKTVSKGSAAPKAAERRTANWWKKYWNHSYIEVQTPDGTTGEQINLGYTLQRWMQACQCRGNSPIKFNGGIFTVDAKYTNPKVDYGNPDHRQWGGDFWWQNTRLIYHPMLKSGDCEMMLPLFDQYFGNLDVMKANARALCGAQGALSPETQTIFGTFSCTDFRWDRTEYTDNMPGNPFIKWHWDSSVEMVALMLDYWDYTGDKEFVRTRLVPYAKEMLTFYDSFYSRNAEGLLEITPTQSLETYWYDVVNDTPTVAGLQECTARLLALPAELSGEADKAFWKRLANCLPQVPVGEVNGKREFLPAERFNPKRTNCENPTLYAIFPFHLCNISTDNLQIGIDSFNDRVEKRDNGWTQDGQQAARLGLADEAAKVIIARVNNSNPAHRFPAMWGPNFDWLPDQNHGGNLLLTLQEMCLQTYDGVDYILPAFPEDWGVKFKLYSFGGKVVKYKKK